MSEPLTAAEIARWLQAVACGAVEAVTSRPVVPAGGVVVSGQEWEVALLIDWQRRPLLTSWARCGGREWWLGCERDWESLGPAVEPLTLMDAERLAEVLLGLPSQPMDEWCPYWDHEAIARRQSAVAAGKRRKNARSR